MKSCPIFPMIKGKLWIPGVWLVVSSRTSSDQIPGTQEKVLGMGRSNSLFDKMGMKQLKNRSIGRTKKNRNSILNSRVSTRLYFCIYWLSLTFYKVKTYFYWLKNEKNILISLTFAQEFGVKPSKICDFSFLFPTQIQCENFEFCCSEMFQK